MEVWGMASSRFADSKSREHMDPSLVGVVGCVLNSKSDIEGAEICTTISGEGFPIWSSN